MSTQQGTSTNTQNKDDRSDLRDVIITTMRDQQQELLAIAARNAEKLVEAKLREKTANDVLLDESAGTSFTTQSCQNDINQINLDFAAQVGKLWERAESMVHLGADPESIIQKGRRLSTDHLTLLRIADAHSWEVAKLFHKSNLVSGEAEERRLSRCKKEVEKRRAVFGNADASGTKPRYEPYPGKFRKPGPRDVAITCWTCGVLGHSSSRCPRKTWPGM